MKTPKELLNYRFTDERQIDSFLEQLGYRHKSRESSVSKKTKKWALSLKGPSVELGEESMPNSLTISKKISELRIRLLVANLLDDERPQHIEEFRQKRAKPFVEETVLARKVTLTRTNLSDSPDVKQLTVWIAEPDERQFSADPWTWNGSFLYLAELWLDDDTSTGMISGFCSPRAHEY